MSTISELKSNVSAMNMALKESVETMDAITLLRNVHPAYRSDYAYKLLSEKTITREQANEFVKMPK